MNTLIVLAVATGTVAFTSTTTKEIDVEESSIEWTGRKILSSHTGTIKLKEGKLKMDGNKLVGGMFVVDMTSINVTDLEGSMKAKLEGHLKSKDFFEVENFPTAVLKITNVKGLDNGTYNVTGDLSIKGITESVDFGLELTDTGAKTNLKVDRSKYNVRYGSGSFFDDLGDKAISDEFELNVSLVF